MERKRRRGLAVVAACAAVALVLLAAFPMPAAPDAALSARLADAVDRAYGAPIRLADLTDFPWDRAHVFGPYASPDEIDAELGFVWRGASTTGIGDHDGVALLVFVRDGAVVRHLLHPGNEGDLTQLDGLGPFTPDSAVFDVRVEDQGEPWRVLRPATRAAPLDD